MQSFSFTYILEGDMAVQKEIISLYLNKRNFKIKLNRTFQFKNAFGSRKTLWKFIKKSLTLL